MHLSKEETKFGLDENELDELINLIPEFTYIKITGLMGMSSLTEDINLIKKEFQYLKKLFDSRSQLQTTNYKLLTLSMGMSSDYRIAVEEGSNMVRIGSLIFGERN